MSSVRTMRRRAAVVALSVTTAATAVAAGGAVALGAANAATLPPVPCSTPVGPPPAHPVITSFAISPRSVDVRKAAKRVTITIRARDTSTTARPITAFGAVLDSPVAGGVRRSVGTGAAFTRVSGSTTDGTWRAHVTIPRWTIAGTWRLQSVSVRSDRGRQTRTPTEASWPSAWPTSLHVRSVTDVTRPRLTKLTLSRTSVTTSSHAQTVHVTGVVKDSRSGFRSGTLVAVSPLRATTGAAWLQATATLTRVGGSRGAARVSGTLHIPRHVGIANRRTSWALTVEVADTAHNMRRYQSSALKSHHFPAAIGVRSAGLDLTGPAVSLAVSATTVDVGSGAKTLTFTAHAKDVSGVAGATASLTGAVGGGPVVAHLRRTGGSATTGVWTASVVLDRCNVRAGQWRAQVVVADRYGNTTVADAPSPVTMIVGAPDAPYLTAESRILQTGGPVLTFNEPTLWALPAASLLTVEDDADATVPGTWTCKNGAATVVVCDAAGADVVTVVFTPFGLLAPSAHYTILFTHPEDISDLAGNRFTGTSQSFLT